MSKFNPNTYLIKLSLNNLLINAFEVPAKDYKTASQLATTMTHKIYPKQHHEIQSSIHRTK